MKLLSLLYKERERERAMIVDELAKNEEAC